MDYRETSPFTKKILVISGWRGAGKTTLCQHLVSIARSAGLDVAGLLSPARIKEGQKTGIEVENLRSGERRLLASRLSGELQGIQLGPWTFDNSMFPWGNQVLNSAIPCHLLVIDELGPLEFDSGQGWAEGFKILDSQLYHSAIVVIRPEYVNPFFERWPDAERYVLANHHDADRLAEEFSNWLQRR